MIEPLKYATISTIYTKDLLFYDESVKDERMQFCKKNGISFLPAPDRKHVYRLVGDEFEMQALTEEMVCNPYDLLFSDKTLAKFERGNHDEVLFVVENGVIKGVVHVVDYNHEFIQFEFFKLISTFERMMRTMLSVNGETNDSLIAWLREKGNKDEHYKSEYLRHVPMDEIKRTELEKRRIDCKPFETFYLSHLIDFSSSKGYLSKESRRYNDKIKWLRNWVAHSKDVTQRRGAAANTDQIESPLYLIDELKKFVTGMNGFFSVYEEVEGMIN